MMRSNNLQRLVALALAAALAACSSAPTAPPPKPTPVATAAPEAPKPPPAPVAPPPPPPPAMPAKVEAPKPVLPAYLDPSSPIFRDRAVYFAFDDARVVEKYTSMLDAHAAFLSKNPAVKVGVEGNTDERGSAEYNLALGQRRADAVVKALELRGVSAGQLEARSWGKEKPVAGGHDEESWARNRRADLVYPDH